MNSDSEKEDGEVRTVGEIKEKRSSCCCCFSLGSKNRA
jgi:hypothetical protein